MKLNVALIEDNADACELLTDWLEEVGQEQEVRCFTEGREALDFFDQEMAKSLGEPRFIPNLIILDLGLPDGSGIDVLKKLKNSPLKNVEVIVNSALSDQKLIKETYRFGSCAFVRKQGDSTILLDSIRTLILAGRIS